MSGIYDYNFFFLAGSVYLLLGQVRWLDIATTLPGFWIVRYLLFAMNRRYVQSWRRTILKYILFLFLCGTCVGLGLLVNVVVTFLYI